VNKLMDEHWERCSPFLQAALDRSIGGYTLAHVKEEIEKGNAQFFPTVNSAGVTRIVPYPSGLKVIELWLAGGNLWELKQSNINAMRWAREIGCHKSVIYGREGWQRELEGYREASRTLVKDL
jgi:hypothetical protein